MTVRKIKTNELMLLTRLFSYNDVEQMIAQNTRDIEQGITDIYVMFDNCDPIGELHVTYESGDERAERGRRAYLSAFRVNKEYRGKGYGKMLMQSVLDELYGQGYREFAIGVEDDNERAKHIYNYFGFTELIARKYEEYQGDGYEFGLYLMRYEN